MSLWHLISPVKRGMQAGRIAICSMIFLGLFVLIHDCMDLFECIESSTMARHWIDSLSSICLGSVKKPNPWGKCQYEAHKSCQRVSKRLSANTHGWSAYSRFLCRRHRAIQSTTRLKSPHGCNKTPCKPLTSAITWTVRLQRPRLRPTKRGTRGR